MVDTHCHLNFDVLQADLAGILERAETAGVDRFIVPATDALTSVSSVNLGEQYPGVFTCVGVHPLSVDEYTEADRTTILELLQGVNSVVSIGEVGLDFYHFEDYPEGPQREAYKERQATLFREMIDLARGYNLPLIIHSREAFTETRSTLEKEFGSGQAVIHCFTGSGEQAQAWLDLNYMLSFTGIITYKKNHELRQVVRDVPLSSIMLETDAPYLAPEGYRGQTCEPRFVREVAQCIAEVKGISVEEVEAVTTAKAEQFFKLPAHA